MESKKRSSQLTGKEIKDIIKQAQKSGVSSLEIKPDGAINIIFDKNNEEEKEIKEDLVAMEHIADEVEQDERVKLTAAELAEMELNDPQEIDKQIALGNALQLPDGSVVPAK